MERQNFYSAWSKSRYHWIMIWLTALLLSMAASAGAVTNGFEIAQEEFSSSGSYGWIVRLESNTGRCTGSLIHPEWILTSSHCVGTAIEAFIGDTQEPVVPDEVKIHKKLDVALLHLPSPSIIGPLQLNAPDTLKVGTRITVVGWGAIDNVGTLPNSPQRGRMYVSDLSLDQITLHPDPALTCVGDRGSPILLGDTSRGWSLVAVNSGSDSNCEPSSSAIRMNAVLNFIGTVTGIGYTIDNLDSDGDGLSDEIEQTLKKKDGFMFSPTDRDSDNDGFPDSIEALQADPHSINVINNEEDLAKVLRKTPYGFLEASALWCFPSHLYSPIYLEAARENAAKQSGFSFNVHQASDDPLTATAFAVNTLRVEAYPTIFLIGPGPTILGKLLGFKDKNSFKRLSSELANAAADGYLSYQEALNARSSSGIGTALKFDTHGFSLLLPPNEDEDSDGLSNGDELAAGTDSFDADSDNDSLRDGQEIEIGLDPLNKDTDKDGFSDGNEVLILNSDPLDPANPTRIDSDGDLIDDPTEIAQGSDPFNPRSFGDPGYHEYLLLAVQDSDNDGWSNLVELVSEFGEVPPSTDSNGDGAKDLPAEIAEIHNYVLELALDFDFRNPSLWPFRVESGTTVTDANANGLPDDQETLATSYDRDRDGTIDLDDELLRLFETF